ncbi:MAG: hypothetical protein K6E90_02610 [Lachnospiraceae bacterium]|nr:hypothetical protein [Lachnospiraceae bacterium]
MTFESRSLCYNVTSTILRGTVNDCYTARPLEGNDGREFTLVVMKDHEAVKSLMEVVVDKSRRGEPADGSNPALIETFTSGDSFVLVFPYRQDRPLDRFFVGEAYTLERCEEICTNLILSCISCGLPYPVLYLILDQGLVNLTRDDGIYLSYSVDLADLDKTKTERDCTVKCADIMLSVLETKSDVKNISYELISRKSANNSYGRFTELYRDLRIASAPVKKSSLIVKIKSFFARNADTLFGILFWVSLILGIIALVLLLTHLVWGDVPFLRIFFNSFKNIGTESLQQ